MNYRALGVTGLQGKQAQAAHLTSFNKQPPRPGNPNNGYGKWQGQNAQQPNKKGNHNAPKSPQVPNLTPMPPINLPWWTCPLTDHEDHTLQSCSEFFSLTARERRWRMISVSCFTCLGRGAPCSSQLCGCIEEVPPGTVCVTFRQKRLPGNIPSKSVLMCPRSSRKAG